MNSKDNKEKDWLPLKGVQGEIHVEERDHSRYSVDKTSARLTDDKVVDDKNKKEKP